MRCLLAWRLCKQKPQIKRILPAVCGACRLNALIEINNRSQLSQLRWLRAGARRQGVSASWLGLLSPETAGSLPPPPPFALPRCLRISIVFIKSQFLLAPPTSSASPFASTLPLALMPYGSIGGTRAGGRGRIILYWQMLLLLLLLAMGHCTANGNGKCYCNGNGCQGSRGFCCCCCFCFGADWKRKQKQFVLHAPSLGNCNTGWDSGIIKAVLGWGVSQN